ncbi:MAG: hypothetical protein Q8L09_04925 [Candidatus Moranbacteria bacterium]|nr:hypothetical protein [Candidatus Moranbacteria bacterium]
MKKNKKRIISAFSVFALILNIFLPTAVWAYSFSLPGLMNGGSINVDVNELLQEANYSSITQISKDASTDISKSTEERYGISKDIWRTAERKTNAPTVEIFFDNTNPKAGEKVTANAIPQFFKNNPANLYYAWYIIHTTDGTSKTATNTISKGKVEAARIMAKGDYDSALDEQSYANGSADPDKDGWPAVDANSYDEDTTAAPFGGSDGVGGLTEESVSAYNTATEWCDSLGDHTWDKCSYDDANSSKPLNTYFTLKSSQTNHYCNLCKDYFSGDGAASYTSAKTARNNCCYTNTPEASLQCSSTTKVTDPDTLEETNTVTYYKCPQDGSTDYCGTTYNSLFDSCYSNFKESNKSIANTCLDTQYNSCKTDWSTVHEDFNGDGFSDYSEQATVGVSRCYKHNFGTNADASIFRENELSDSATDNSSGLDFPVSCKHKWSSAPGFKSGSGKFTTEEEDYWETDPFDPDTSGDGFNDEASVIGLGQETFSWTYAEGDRVGVVVEGTSMLPTDEKSAYYKLMWGYPDTCDSTKAGLLAGDQCDGSDDYGYGFLATKSPSEESTEEKLQVSLFYSPENPIADSSDANKDNIEDDGTITDADQITVTSSLDNTNLNPSALYYAWYIQEKNSEGEWKKMDIATYFDTSSSSSGMGISSFDFTPKKKAMGADITTFKVTLAVSRTSEVSDSEKDSLGRTTPKKGWASAEIPVNPNGIKINLYKVNIENSKATFDKSKDTICDKDLYQLLCPAVQYQMMAAKISGSKYTKSNSEFFWTLNGETLAAPSGASSLFDGWDDVTVFFPITKGEREVETLSVTATPKNNLQPVTGSRLITVVTPALFIKSSDTSASWTTTQIVEDSGKKFSSVDVERTNMLEAKAGAEVSYYLDFVPDYLLADDPDNTLINWTVNGESWREGGYESDSALGSMTTENNDQAAKFTVSGTEGIYYTLGASIKKYWSDEEKAILSDAWGISPRTLEGENSVTITTVILEPGIDGVVAGPQQILAAIGTHLPHYFMYVLRLTLTLAVMFFLSVGFYALSSKLEL